MFATGYNQGLKAIRDALPALLIELWALEFDSNGEEVQFEEDGNPLSKARLALPPKESIIDLPRSSINDDLASTAPSSHVASATNSTDVTKL